jgi:hypothetical protein
MKSELGTPMTLGNDAAGVRFRVWCRERQHQVRPIPPVR